MQRDRWARPLYPFYFGQICDKPVKFHWRPTYTSPQAWSAPARARAPPRWPPSTCGWRSIKATSLRSCTSPQRSVIWLAQEHGALQSSVVTLDDAQVVKNKVIHHFSYLFYHFDHFCHHLNHWKAVEAEDVPRSQPSVCQRIVSAVSVQTGLGGSIFHCVTMVVICIMLYGITS